MHRFGLLYFQVYTSYGFRGSILVTMLSLPNCESGKMRCPAQFKTEVLDTNHYQMLFHSLIKGSHGIPMTDLSSLMSDHGSKFGVSE